jgi:hypothetical protein
MPHMKSRSQNLRPRAGPQPKPEEFSALWMHEENPALICGCLFFRFLDFNNNLYIAQDLRAHADE